MEPVSGSTCTEGRVMPTWKVLGQSPVAVILQCECHIPVVVHQFHNVDVDRARHLAEEMHHEFQHPHTDSGWSTIDIVDHGPCVACGKMREFARSTCPDCTEKAVQLLLLTRGVEHPHGPVNQPERDSDTSGKPEDPGQNAR